jgi:hypothetical protein
MCCIGSFLIWADRRKSEVVSFAFAGNRPDHRSGLAGDLKHQQKALRKEIEDLEEERKLALIDSRTQTYNDGHARVR